MARTTRIIHDDFPAGTIDREALRATFQELRDRPASRRNGSSGAVASRPAGSSGSSRSGDSRGGRSSSAGAASSSARG